MDQFRAELNRFDTTLEIIRTPGDENSVDMGTRPTHDWTRADARRRHHFPSPSPYPGSLLYDLDLLKATDAIDEFSCEEATCDPDGRELEFDDDIPSSQS